MSGLIQVDAVVPMIVSSFLASICIVVLFSLGVAATGLGAGDRPGGHASATARRLGRWGAVTAFVLFAAVLVLGLVVLTNK
jgi:hypothetical protein